MRLLQRTTRYQVRLAIPIVVIGTAIGYFLVNKVVTDQVDEQLGQQAEDVAAALHNGQRSFATDAPDELVHVVLGAEQKAVLKDTSIYDAGDLAFLPWRIGRFSTKAADGQVFVVTLGRSMVESTDLVISVAISMTLLLALLTTGGVLMNRWLSRRLWKPFQDTIDSMGQFGFDGSATAPLPPSDISEFDTLNRTMNMMTAKLQRDFTAQKRFTEQAAHELQTPLSILQGKLDLLIQSDRLGAEEAELITGLLRTRERMSRTVDDLLMLSRIGNQQFAPSSINWRALFQQHFDLLEGLIEQGGIRATIEGTSDCDIRLHPILADLLVANLLRNAVQHNIPNGTIDVTIDAIGFTISNTGAPPSVDTSTLFDRFAKGDPSSSSTGLGLSIVKEICDSASLGVIYRFSVGMHSLVVQRI